MLGGGAWVDGGTCGGMQHTWKAPMTKQPVVAAYKLLVKHAEQRAEKVPGERAAVNTYGLRLSAMPRTI